MANETGGASPDTTTVAPAETQAAETTPQNAAPLTAEAQHDELANLLADPNWKPETKAEATETAAAETVAAETPAGETPPETEQPATETTPAETVTEQEEPEEETKTQRFRFSDPADRKFAVLRKEGVAPEEAARIAYGLGVQQTQQTETEAADPLAALQTEMAEVDAKLEAAGANEGVIDKDTIALIQKRSDLAADIKTQQAMRQRDQRDAVSREEAQAAQARESQQEVASKATERFPMLADAKSPLRIETDKLIVRLKGSALMSEQDAPVQIAEMAALSVAKANAAANKTSVAVELAKLDKSISAAAAPATTAPPVVPPKPQPPAAKIVARPGAQTTQKPDQPATEVDKFKQVLSDPRAEHERLNALLYGT